MSVRSTFVSSVAETAVDAAPVRPDLDGDHPAWAPAPIGVRSLALSLIAAAVVIVLLRHMQEVFIPFVLAGLLFDTLDPFVDRLNRLLPRPLAAALVLGVVMSAIGAGAYFLSDDAMAALDDLPSTVRKVRLLLNRVADQNGAGRPGPLEIVQEAAKEMEQAAEETIGSSTPRRGVVRVQVDEPAFRASTYLVAGSWSVPSLVGSALLITSLEGWLLTPMLMGRVAQMNPVAIFGGLLFWSWTWGVWGVLLAVPMMMVIKSVCDRVKGLQPIGKFLGE